jgi:hypothetical protein
MFSLPTLLPPLVCTHTPASSVRLWTVVNSTIRRTMLKDNVKKQYYYLIVTKITKYVLRAANSQAAARPARGSCPLGNPFQKSKWNGFCRNQVLLKNSEISEFRNNKVSGFTEKF